ncbi:MAG: hypothetical protein JXB45_07095 [Candidatus Krumholzibacteriota bacterium]|nr:hypothetical protein [Candidatus Krumholzibacteriota bacterium]
MNKISFNGATGVINEFKERFLTTGPGRLEPLEEVGERYGDILREIASAYAIEVRFLVNVVDYLLENAVLEAQVESIIEDKPEDLVGLARDVEVLEKYLRNGTIKSVTVFDELRL